MTQTIDIIDRKTANDLHGLFLERVRRTPENIAYRQFNKFKKEWQDITWRKMSDEVARWQAALKQENLQPGDRVGIILRNSPEWVKFEQAALSLGLVVVPLYTNDRPDNIAYIIQDADIRCLLLEDRMHWEMLAGVLNELDSVQRFICLNDVPGDNDKRLKSIREWIPENAGTLEQFDISPDDMASIVYTSGTTGRPKGVMLSHDNILWNACVCTECESFYVEDVYLSFLPLSHMLERTAGYYLPMVTGATTAYARSIDQLAEDLLTIKPTILISVPRIYERVNNKINTQLESKSSLARKLFAAAVATGWQRFQHQQNRAGWRPQQLLWPLFNKLVAGKIMQKLGGRMRLAICGGAPLPNEVARTFIGLGLPLLQGYGMTELSPVVSVNRLVKNDPVSVGPPLPNVEVRLGHKDELLVRGPGVMKGYWNNDKATDEVLNKEGWMHTGDVAKIENEYIYITGRIKDIIVMGNGEKVPPADVEMAISHDPLFEQVLVIGEGKPFLSCITVLDPDSWKQLANQNNLDPDDPATLEDKTILKAMLKKINHQLHDFPGYTNIYSVKATLEPWTIDDGLITPTLKLKRKVLIEKYKDDIDQFYKRRR